MLKLCDLAIDLSALADCLGAHIAAIRCRVRSQREEFFDLAQRKAELLRLSNEVNAFDNILVVIAEAAAARPWWLLDQPAPFLEADGLDADTGTLSRAADGQTGSHDLFSGRIFPPYYGTESRQSISPWHCSGAVSRLPNIKNVDHRAVGDFAA